MTKCPGCGSPLGNRQGESALTNGSDIILCEPCWLVEDALIEVEGTNSPRYSARVHSLLERYRANGATVTSIP